MGIEAGQALLHYRVVEKIGEGGMGVVWKAIDTSLDRPVAIKILPEEFARDAGRRTRFTREARVLASLNHPNIAAVYGLHETDDVRFLAMELIPGEDLAQRLARGPMTADEALAIAGQVTDGLEAAHDQGVVHRDLKPANIMLTDGGVAKVMDFGLAKQFSAGEPDRSNGSATATADPSLTRDGVAIGTPAYMSPEQLRAEPVDSRSDIFSFGVLLYEMLAGTHPFRKAQTFETISGILRDDPPPMRDSRDDLAPPLEGAVRRLLEKHPDRRCQTIGEVRTELDRAARSTARADSRRRWRWIAAAAAVGIVALAVAGTAWSMRRAKVRWARDVAVPEIERMIDDSWRDFTEPYALAVEAERFLPDDPEIAALFARCSVMLDVTTEPEAADVYVKEYGSPTDDWHHLGVTPLTGVRLPIGILRWKFEKPGFETVLAAESTWALGGFSTDAMIGPNHVTRRLDPAGTVPDGMVRVRGAATALGELGDFYIDRHEVTNREFKAFVDGGGYRTREYWTHEFIDGDTVLGHEQAMVRFIDSTGRPGPATWQAGDYPDGQDDLPVTGVSWYEAAAYAAFAKQVLPTGAHWGLARGEATMFILFPQLGGFAVLAPFSNFDGAGPVAVESRPGITAYGAYDMAGNAREWCANETTAGRLIRGGSWSDVTYMFKAPSQAPAMDRSPHNGFRCALYLDPEAIPQAAFGPLAVSDEPDRRGIEPVSDEVFEVWRERFSYDRTDLNATIESTRETDDWTLQRVTYDAAYGGERIIANLFLPKNAEPPYQTVVYVPGSAPFFHGSSEDIETYYEYPIFLSFVVNNGRAVLFPVFKGTFERRDPSLASIIDGSAPHRYTEFFVQLVKDFRRSVDYLESRDDIDPDRIAYLGMSWGAIHGGTIPAIENRLAASVLVSGGAALSLAGAPVPSARPEAEPLHFLPRVRVPTRMINGRHDMILSLDRAILPMYELLGTPDADKDLMLFDTDHIPPRVEFIRGTLEWLDRYLGPVRPIPQDRKRTTPSNTS